VTTTPALVPGPAEPAAARIDVIVATADDVVGGSAHSDPIVHATPCACSTAIHNSPERESPREPSVLRGLSGPLGKGPDVVGLVERLSNWLAVLTDQDVTWARHRIAK
jgi:hypothetical protein